MNLKGRNFLTLKDFTPEEILYLLDLSADLKAKKKAGELTEYYKGKNIALIFEKTSTRTRCSFEVAAHDLGMGSTYLDPTGSQIGKKESIADTARVLGRMYDGIEYRLDKTNIIHCPIGKASFGAEKLTENFETLLEAIVKAKPAAAKGTYIKSCTVASTMGVGVPVSTSKYGV